MLFTLTLRALLTDGISLVNLSTAGRIFHTSGFLVDCKQGMPFNVQICLNLMFYECKRVCEKPHDCLDCNPLLIKDILIYCVAGLTVLFWRRGVALSVMILKTLCSCGGGNGMIKWDSYQG